MPTFSLCLPHQKIFKILTLLCSTDNWNHVGLVFLYCILFYPCPEKLIELICLVEEIFRKDIIQSVSYLLILMSKWEKTKKWKMCKPCTLMMQWLWAWWVLLTGQVWGQVWLLKRLELLRRNRLFCIETTEKIFWRARTHPSRQMHSKRAFFWKYLPREVFPQGHHTERAADVIQKVQTPS